MRGVVRTLICGAAFLLPGLYLSAEKTLTLVDRGQKTVIKTFAADVKSLLNRQELLLSPGDVINSRLRSPLPKRVVIARAQSVIVVVDGEKRIERVAGFTVGQVLNQLSIPLDGADISPAPSHSVRPNDEIVVNRSKEIKVVHDGKTESVVTTDLTVEAVLKNLQIELGPLDRVEPALDVRPLGGTEIRVERLGKSLESVTSPIPFKKVMQNTSSLEVGVKKLNRSGRQGVRVREYQVTSVDGKASSRQLVSDRIVQRPQDEIYLVGNYRPPPPALSVQAGRATWYQRTGLCAAHRTLPMGTNVLVTNVTNGRQVTVTINDRGPFGSGRIIDLSDDAFAQLAPLGTGVIDVKIAW